MAEVFNFSLERDDHLGILATKLHSMFEQGRFVDFKLAASDGRILKVHRFILCAFSQYFEVIETQSLHQRFPERNNINYFITVYCRT